MSVHVRIVAFRREQLEALIEELIALLDLLDGDENLEPYLAGLDEFSLDDREAEDENDEDGADAEPERQTRTATSKTVVGAKSTISAAAGLPQENSKVAAGYDQVHQM